MGVYAHVLELLRWSPESPRVRDIRDDETEEAEQKRMGVWFFRALAENASCRDFM